MVIIFLATLFLSVLAIVARWIGHSLSFAEPLSRHLILLLAFVGGVSAIEKNVHIKIDLFSSLFEKKISSTWTKWIHSFILILSAMVSFFLVKASYDFYLVEQEFGAEGILGFHSSHLVSIIFLGFSLVFMKYVLSLLITLTGDRHD